MVFVQQENIREDIKIRKGQEITNKVHITLASRNIAILIAIFTVVSCAISPPPNISLSSSNYQAEIEQLQKGLDSTLEYLESHGSKFGLDKTEHFKKPNPEEREELVTLWAGVLDYMAHLDLVRYHNQQFYKHIAGEIEFNGFVSYYMAFLVQSSRAVHLINILERNEALPTVLNEANLDYGLQAESYSQFKTHFLHARQAAEFGALQVIYRDRRPEVNPFYTKIAMLEGYNTSLGIDYGVRLSVQHAFDMIEEETFSWWFPIQKDFAKWAGHAKISREVGHLISPQNVIDIHAQLEPGDIMFQRREWELTNAGIPGYWTHTALFVGSPDERIQLFDDNRVKSWVRSKGVESGSFEELLQKSYPTAYASHIMQPDSIGVQNVLEAVGRGVIFQTLSHSLTCDGLGAVRPRISKVETATSIYNAFRYHGSGYDYNFDFLTDSTLVCSELVYKAFEPSGTFGGIAFNTEKVAGRMMTPVNIMVKQFDKEYDSINLDFVLFYDGDEAALISRPSTEAAFRDSWRRLGLYQTLPSELLMLNPNIDW